MNTFIEKYTKASKVITNYTSIGFAIISVILYVLNILVKFEIIPLNNKVSIFLEIFFIRYMNIIVSNMLLILVLPNILNFRKIYTIVIEIILYLHIIWSIVFIFYNSFKENQSIEFEWKILFNSISLSKFSVIVFLLYGAHLGVQFNKNITYILIPLSIYLLQYYVAVPIFIELKYKLKAPTGYFGYNNSSHMFKSVYKSTSSENFRPATLINSITRLTFVIFVILIYDFIFTSRGKNINISFDMNDIISFFAPGKVTQEILILIHIVIFSGVYFKIDSLTKLNKKIEDWNLPMPIIFMAKNLAISKIAMIPVLLLATLLTDIIDALNKSINNSVKFYICFLQLMCYIYFISGDYEVSCMSIFYYFMFSIMSVILLSSIYGVFINKDFILLQKICSTKLIIYMIFFFGVLTAINFKNTKPYDTFGKYKEDIKNSTRNSTVSQCITHFLISDVSCIILFMFVMSILLGIIRIYCLIRKSTYS